MAHTVWQAVRNSIVHPVPLPILAGLLFAQTGWKLPEMLDRPLQVLAAALGPKSGSPGMVNRVIAQSRSFQSDALKQALLTLADANVASRSGGDPKPYLERLIIELCR